MKRHSRKKYISVILALNIAAISFLSLSGCSGSQAETDTQGGTLRVAFVNGGDKYTYLEDGQPYGIEPYLAGKIAESASLTLETTVLDNNESLYSALQDNSFDLAFGRIADTSVPAQSYALSRSYGKGGLYIVAKKYDYTDSLSVLRSGSIGVMTSVQPYIEQVPGASGVVQNGYEDMPTMVKDIEDGVITVGLCSEREALGALSDTIQTQEVLQSPRESYVALMPQGSSLQGAVNAAIAEYYDEVLRGEDIGAEPVR